MVSPKVGSNKRIPCKPIAPATVNVASSSVTLTGILVTKFLGTQTNLHDFRWKQLCHQQNPLLLFQQQLLYPHYNILKVKVDLIC